MCGSPRNSQTRAAYDPTFRSRSGFQTATIFGLAPATVERRAGSASSSTSERITLVTRRRVPDLRRPYGLEVPYQTLFQGFEAILARHGGRPHWVKAHSLRPDTLRKLYPRFDDFVRVLDDVDPDGIFRNEYVQRHIFGKTGPEYDGGVFRHHAGRPL